MQTRRIEKQVDAWLQNPVYTFESHGHLVADGAAIGWGKAMKGFSRIGGWLSSFGGWVGGFF